MNCVDDACRIRRVRGDKNNLRLRSADRTDNGGEVLCRWRIVLVVNLIELQVRDVGANTVSKVLCKVLIGGNDRDRFTARSNPRLNKTT